MLSHPRGRFASALVIAVVAGAALVTTVGAAATSPAPKVTSLTVTSGPSSGGTRVTVKGADLNHVVAVTFDGIKGTSLKVSGSHTSLQITTPLHAAGAAHVRVKTTSGTSALGTKDLYTFRTYTSIATGSFHTCAVGKGAVRCWGSNAYGELGDNTTTDSSVPIKVHGLAHVVAVTAGGSHSCALITDGTVRCWGYNAYGQLGNNTTTDSHLPVKVSGLTQVVALSAGLDHTCALLANGTASCWGLNNVGQLGDGTTAMPLVPVKVHSLTHVTSIGAGGESTCALQSDAIVSCWGLNNHGQLGDGTTNDAHAPIRVLHISHPKALSVGSFSACALVSGGAVRCWGSGGVGELGNGGTTDSSTAVAVASLSKASALSSGGGESCAIVRGQTFCWGYNIYGQVGDGTTADTGRLTPAAVGQLGTSTEISAGGEHTCARLATGSLRCWGYNLDGELGNGTTTNSALPVSVIGL
jgi:alpha-tubulin suppressor-like RCC1 family protein